MVEGTADGRDAFQFALDTGQQFRFLLEVELADIFRRGVTHLVDGDVHIRQVHLSLEFRFRLIDEILVDHDQLAQVGSGDAHEVHLEAHGDDRDLDLVAHLRIVVIDESLLEGAGTAGMLGNQLADGLDIVHLEALVVAAAGHVDQQALGRLEVEIVEQRGLQRALDRLLEPLVAGARAAAHQGHAAAAHHVADILEVHVDIARAADDLGDAAHGRRQDLIRVRERLVDQQVAVVFVELLVVDDQQGVHVRL